MANSQRYQRVAKNFFGQKTPFLALFWGERVKKDNVINVLRVKKVALDKVLLYCAISATLLNMFGTEDLVRYVSEALTVTTKLSMPAILIAAGVGTCVAVIQAITQIQEQTLAFAIKLIAIGLVLLLMANMMAATIYVYTVRGFDLIATMGQ